MFRAQNDQKLTDLWYEHDSFHAKLTTYAILSQASDESLRVADESLESYRIASASSQLYLESDLFSRLGKLLSGPLLCA